MQKLIMLGADGFMGKLISKLAVEDGGFEIVGAFSVASSPNLGQDLGTLIGTASLGVAIQSMEQYELALQNNAPDVVVDFTAAEGTEQYAPLTIKAGVPMVIGTTGLPAEFKATLEKLCAETKTPVVFASNMATGVNVFFKLTEYLTKALKDLDWDIEVIEKHHHRKMDSPSGTALTLAETIAQGLGANLDEVGKFGRDKGPNPRKIGKKEIGIHAIRAGDIVGEHTILFAGMGERIEITHRAHSRECFASGTIQCAKFLKEHRDEGKVFDMMDVLGL